MGDIGKCRAEPSRAIGTLPSGKAARLLQRHGEQIGEEVKFRGAGAAEEDGDLVADLSGNLTCIISSTLVRHMVTVHRSVARSAILPGSWDCAYLVAICKNDRHFA